MELAERRGMPRTLLLCSLFLLAACGGGLYGSPGDFGATPGGVKDLRHARELIAAGQVPPSEALLVEGMFSEHDLGVAGEPCARLLCLRAAGGVAPDRAGSPRGWLHVGLSSSIDPEQWQRPATTFIFTVDVSGSMGWGYRNGEHPSPGELSRLLLHRLADELRPEDQVALVTYGSAVATPLGLTAGSEVARVHAAIDALKEAGSTNMEAGLRRAYELGRQAAPSGRNVRVVLFTDVQPNVGATTSTEFEQIVAGGAGDQVAITVLALGLGIGPEVLQGMAHLRGANAFTLFDGDDADRFMAEEYPWFTTPIAYELAVGVQPSTGLAVAEAYGFPAGPDGSAVASIEVSTVFLSKRKGALLVSLAPEGEGALEGMAADLSLSFTSPAGAAYDQHLRVDRAGAALDERGQWFAQASTAKATALALLVSGMHEAAVQYATSPEQAEATMRAAHERFAADASALADPALAPEVELSAAMLELIVQRAPQGTLYGQY